MRFKLTTSIGYSHFIKGVVYRDDYREDVDCNSVYEMAQKWPEDWKLVKDECLRFTLLRPIIYGNFKVGHTYNNKFDIDGQDFYISELTSFNIQDWCITDEYSKTETKTEDVKTVIQTKKNFIKISQDV
jgi:hypothetical protein